MDWLLVFVVVAVVGQLCLPLVGAWRRKVDRRQLAERRADLLEAAADQQLVAIQPRTAKLNENQKGVAGD